MCPNFQYFWEVCTGRTAVSDNFIPPDESSMREDEESRDRSKPNVGLSVSSPTLLRYQHHAPLLQRKKHDKSEMMGSGNPETTLAEPRTIFGRQGWQVQETVVVRRTPIETDTPDHQESELIVQAGRPVWKTRIEPSTHPNYLMAEDFDAPDDHADRYSWGQSTIDDVMPEQTVQLLPIRARAAVVVDSGCTEHIGPDFGVQDPRHQMTV